VKSPLLKFPCKHSAQFTKHGSENRVMVGYPWYSVYLMQTKYNCPIYTSDNNIFSDRKFTFHACH